MYSTCLFCHSELGTNETIESFPVGRRLAFDSAKGRLWVICRKCERWNLTPLDERWEAVEQCERLFSQTRLRVSSDNIGLSRLRDGMELVRIGNPLRPEMAAWRYGDQFGRRRRRYLMTTGAVAVAGVGVLAGGWATGVIAGGGFGLFQLVNGVQKAIRDRIVRARVTVPGREGAAVLRGQDMRRIVIASVDGQLAIRIPDHHEGMKVVGQVADPSRPGTWRRRWGTRDQIQIVGPDALRVAAAVLPGVNLSGASREEVSSAVGYLERTPDPYQLFLTATRIPTSRSRVSTTPVSVIVRSSNDPQPPGTALVDRLPKPLRLALEMAAHEDIERRAMQGELSMLERAWKEAEEIAAISDSMFVPAGVDEKLAEIKSR